MAIMESDHLSWLKCLNTELYERITVRVINLSGSIWNGVVKVDGFNLLSTSNEAFDDGKVKNIFRNESLFLAEYGYRIRMIKGRNIYPELSIKIDSEEKIPFNFGMVIATFVRMTDKELRKYRD